MRFQTFQWTLIQVYVLEGAEGQSQYGLTWLASWSLVALVNTLPILLFLPQATSF